MMEYTGPIRKDRTKCYFFFTVEELMAMIEEMKKKKTKR